MSHNDQKQKNKPANTLFKQQRLASWQPIMSPPHVCACFVTVAAIFIPIGAAIFTANSAVVDLEARYDNIQSCTSSNNEGTQSYTWSDGVNGTTQTTSMGCRTQVTLNVPKQLEPPIYLYYGLKNFYQNHRSYAKSRNEKQLAGDPITTDSDLFDARPLRRPGENLLSAQYGGGEPITVNSYATNFNGMTYNPAGLVPWSMFNDTFRLSYVDKSGNSTMFKMICDTSLFRKLDSSPIQPSWTSTPNRTLFGYDYATGGDWNFTCDKLGIAWTSDRDVKYKVPPLSDEMWTADRLEYLPTASATDFASASWNATWSPTTTNSFLKSGWYAGEAGHQVPVTTDEDLMVWMRTSALPNFRKLFRIINVPIPAGEYIVEIEESYDVSSFSGEKYVALATVSWIGGKNGFLGIAYIAVGATAFVAGVVFFLVHRALGDRTQRAVDALNDLQ